MSYTRLALSGAMLSAVALAFAIFPELRNEAPKLAVGATTASQAADTIVVKMSASMISADPIFVSGWTNLPNGTAISIMLFDDAFSEEPPHVQYKNSLGQAKSVVQNHYFSVGRELLGGRKLRPGRYVIDIITTGQTQAVLNLIGERGEKLAGPLVVSLGKNGYIAATYPYGRESNYFVHFSQTISLTETLAR